MDSTTENDSTPSGNTVNSDALEPLLTLAIGASEEVNTTSNSKGKTEKNSYMLRSKNSTSKGRNQDDSSQGNLNSTPLNSPIINTESPRQPTNKENEFQIRVIPSNEVDLNPVLMPEQINLVQVQEDGIPNEINGNAGTTEGQTLPTGLVMIEQSVLEQISGFLRNATTVSSGSMQKIITNTATANAHITTPVQDQQTVVQSNTNGSSQTDPEEMTDATHQPLLSSDDNEWIDTKATALQLTDELRRYHIPQAVFARKVLNRSQGTLSDILRKPKPWNEMRLGKEIFRKMKEWLSLPEVKRIPQLRMEAAKELDSRSKRHITDSEDIRQDIEIIPKKVRRQFTESQKRALFAIFKETKKPTKEMQRALAEELGLDLNTVSNFFMNARRRYTVE